MVSIPCYQIQLKYLTLLTENFVKVKRFQFDILLNFKSSTYLNNLESFT